MAEPRAHKRYMPDRVSLAGVAIAAALILGAIALGALGAVAAIRLGNEDRAASAGVARLGAPPPIEASAQLQPEPAQDIQAFTADKRRLLSSYGWVDRERGIARIPIDRAMALLAQHDATTPTRP